MQRNHYRYTNRMTINKYSCDWTLSLQAIRKKVNKFELIARFMYFH